jgi:hypothetical protein
MLSHVKSPNGLGILYFFLESKIIQRMSQELREEFKYLGLLATKFESDFVKSFK